MFLGHQDVKFLIKDLGSVYGLKSLERRLNFTTRIKVNNEIKFKEYNPLYFATFALAKIAGDKFATNDQILEYSSHPIVNDTFKTESAEFYEALNQFLSVRNVENFIKALMELGDILFWIFVYENCISYISENCKKDSDEFANLTYMRSILTKLHENLNLMLSRFGSHTNLASELIRVLSLLASIGKAETRNRAFQRRTQLKRDNPNVEGSIKSPDIELKVVQNVINNFFIDTMNLNIEEVIGLEG